MTDETLTQLLTETTTGGTSLFDVDSIMQQLAPFIWALTIVSLLITVLYLFSLISKWRTNKAIIDIKKLLVEMNERDKLRAIPAAQDVDAPAARDDSAVATPTTGA